MRRALLLVVCLAFSACHQRPIEVKRIRAVVSTPKPTIRPTPLVRHLNTRRTAPRPPVAAVQRFQGSIWDCIALHESGGNWASQEGGYEGGLDFLHSTWVAAGGRKYAEHAYQATREQQIAIAQAWLAQTSWAQWPNTSRMCGVR